MATFLAQLLAPGAKAPRWFTALVVVAMAGAGWWYASAAIGHGNSVTARIDHLLSIEHARHMKLTDMPEHDQRPVERHARTPGMIDRLVQNALIGEVSADN